VVVWECGGGWREGVLLRGINRRRRTMVAVEDLGGSGKKQRRTVVEVGVEVDPLSLTLLGSWTIYC